MKPSFKAELKAKLSPVLRAQGFRGSTVTFRRVSGIVLQVVHVQGASDGGSCCVEIGTHLTFLPTVLEDTPDPKKLSVTDCEFRRRMSPDHNVDHWWTYGDTDEDAARSADRLVTTLTTIEVPRMEREREFPGVFELVTPEHLVRNDVRVLPGRSVLAREALTLARIAHFRSRPNEARRFIAIGLRDLEKTPDMGLGIRNRLNALSSALGVET